MFDPSSPFLTPSDPLSPIPKTTFAEDRLKTALLLCELEPGTVATEVDIAQRFGLGRAATRVALARLSALGLVHPIPRQGWKVLPISGALIGQVIGARRLAEPGLAQTVLSPPQIARLHELATMIDVLGRNRDAGAQSSRRGYEREFLEMTADGLNPLIATYLRTLWDHSARILHYLEKVGGDILPDIEATALAEAFAARDTGRIIALRQDALDTFEAFCTAALLRDPTELGARAPSHASSGQAGTLPADPHPAGADRKAHPATHQDKRTET